MAIPSWSTRRIYGTWTDAEGTRLAGRAVASIRSAESPTSSTI